jgi:hypothetical protein
MAIDLDVTDSGGALALCCRAATIDQPMALDANGRFDVTGAETFVSNPKRMHFYGSVRGDAMTLLVEIWVGGGWFPLPGWEGTDNLFVLHPGVAGTWHLPSGAGTCICDSSAVPIGISQAGRVPADVPSNMQWQTIAEAKAKDRTERTRP